MEGYLEKILKMFRFYACDEQTLVSKQKLTEILSRQAEGRLQTGFSPQIIEQIWGQAETTSRGEATALTFSKIYAQAITILEARISMIDGRSGVQQMEEQLILEQCKLADLEEQYEKGYAENYDRVNTVRKNIVVIQNKIQELLKNRVDFQKQLDEMKACINVQQKVEDQIIEKSQIIQSHLQKNIELDVPNQDLSLIFKATLIGICLQLPFLNYHPWFLPLICYFLIIYWLFLGYYDQYFVKKLLLGLLLSCLMDIMYTCFVFIDNIGSFRFYNKSTPWRYVSMAFLMIELAFRVFLLIKLSNFKEPNAKRQFFILFDHEIQLKTRSGKVFSSRLIHD